MNADDRLAAEQALADSSAKSVAAIEGFGLQGLRQALQEASGKVHPDRSVLPIPDRSFGGTVKRVVFDLQPPAHGKDQALHEHAARASR